jgi:hypothetical protein
MHVIIFESQPALTKSKNIELNNFDLTLICLSSGAHNGIDAILSLLNASLPSSSSTASSVAALSDWSWWWRISPRLLDILIVAEPHLSPKASEAIRVGVPMTLMNRLQPLNGVSHAQV